MNLRHPKALLLLVAALALVLPPADAAPGPATTLPAMAAGAPASRAISAYVPKIKHVFVVNIENKGYDETWGDSSAAPYLAKTLRRKGVLLNSYYGTAHLSQSNYVAQISGQGPNPQMQYDCQTYSTFVQTGTADPGQAVGTGCIFPKGVPSLPGQLSSHHKRWKGYMEGMVRNCQHPTPDTMDDTQKATAEHMYATRHNPFAYFSSVIGRPAYCKKHVVKLSALDHDLAKAKRTPNLVYITPDLCSDGHDEPCADGRPGGLVSVNRWMKNWIPKILKSPAFKRNGMLVITADESDGPQSDSSACCGEGPSTNSPMPGINGLGGGKIGALVISKYTKPNTWSTTPYNHYSLLGSIEEIFRLDKLGYAQTADLDFFGLDVYNSGWNE